MQRFNIFRKQGSSQGSSSSANVNQTINSGSSSSRSRELSSPFWDPDEENRPPSSSSSSRTPATSTMSIRFPPSSPSSPSSFSRHGYFKKEPVRRPITREIIGFRFHCNCGKAYTTPKQLKTHLTVSETGRVFRCLRCSRAFQTNSELKKHLKRVHYLNPPKTFGCSRSGKQFDSFGKLLNNRKLKGYKDVKLGIPVLGFSVPKWQRKITHFFLRVKNNRNDN